MASNPGEAAEVVVVAIVVIDLKANAEVAVVVTVLRANAAKVESAVKVVIAVKVVNAVEAEVETVVAVEEADHELLFLKVKTVQLWNVLSVEARETDSKEKLAKRTIHLIVRMALVVADAATRRVATARATGVKKHQSQRIAMLLPLKAKLLLRQSPKEGKESQEKSPSQQSQRRKSDSLLTTTSLPNRPNLRDFWSRRKPERMSKLPIRRLRSQS